MARLGWLRKGWYWFALLLILLAGAWCAAYRLDEPAWEMNHHGFIMAEWPHNAANLLRFGLATRTGQVTDYGWQVPPTGFSFRIDHPPVLSWTIALSYLLCGVHEWSARLIPLLFSLVMVFLIFVWVRQMASIAWGLLAAVFAAGSPAFLYYARLPVPHVPAVCLSVATFLLYRQWVEERKPRYLIGMWFCFAIGAWTDWIVYFVMPWILLHYLLFHYRERRDRRFLAVSVVLPPALFVSYLLWAWIVGGIGPLMKLVEIFRWRTALGSDSQIQRGVFTGGDLYRLCYGWVSLYLTPILRTLVLVWFVSVLIKTFKRSLSRDGFLVLCLFLYGLVHNLFFTNRVYFHDFITAFEWIPFFAIAGALGVRVLVGVLPLPWRYALSAVLVPLVLWGFVAQSCASVKGLHRERLVPDYFLAATQVATLVPPDGKVMLSFNPDIRFRFYLDRPVAQVTTLKTFEATLAKDPTFSHYVFGPGSVVDEPLRRHLVARYPVRYYGEYVAFDLAGNGPVPLLDDRALASVPQPLDVRFGEHLALRGYEWQPGRLTAGEGVSWWERHFNAHAELLPAHNIPVELTLYWQAVDAISTDLEVRTELVTAYGPHYVIAQRRLPLNGVFPTSMWTAGEVVRELYQIEIPADTPQLRYVLQLSVVDTSTGKPLTVSPVDDGATVAGEHVTLGDLELEPAQPVVSQDSASEAQAAPEVDLDNGLIFQRYRVRTADGTGNIARAGQQIGVSTSWAVDGFVDDDYPAWVELRNGRVDVRAPLELAPTRLWRPGASYARAGVLSLSPYLLPGSYALDLVVGESPAQRIGLEEIQVEWANGARWVIDQRGTPDFASDDVNCLDTDQPARLSFELDHPVDLDVTAGWTGDALVDEAWVEVYLKNRNNDERFLTTWVVPKGDYTVSSLHIPAKLTAQGANVITLRVPEDRGKPHFLGWRSWVDAVFPDLLYDTSGPHDGWVCPDFIQVASPWSEEWSAYRDLARTYLDLEMYAEAIKLFDRIRSEELRPARLSDLNIFLAAAAGLDDPDVTTQIEEFVRSEIAHSLDVNLGDKVEVLGYALERQDESSGLLKLYFRALRPMEYDYTIWLHQTDEGADDFLSLDRRVVTSDWDAGQIYEETWPISVPSGKARFSCGFWRWEDGSRLWVKGHADQHEVDLGWIDLEH